MIIPTFGVSSGERVEWLTWVVMWVESANCFVQATSRNVMERYLVGQVIRTDEHRLQGTLLMHSYTKHSCCLLKSPLFCPWREEIGAWHSALMSSMTTNQVLLARCRSI